MRQPVVVVGSANQDIVVRVDRVPLLGETILGESVAYLAGGKGLNQACAAASAGADTFFVGAVGADAAGEQLRAALTDAGVDVRFTAELPGVASGTAHILVSEGGGNQIVVVPSANSQVSPAAAQEALDGVTGAPIVVLQGEIPFETTLEAARMARSRGGRAVFNLAPAAKVPAELLELSTPLVVNEFEAGLVLEAPAPTTAAEAEDAAAALLELSPEVIVTLGALGSVVADAEGITYLPAAKVDQVVDTTGAGDAFVGVLAAELAQGRALLEAAELATAASGASVTRAGASGSYSAIRELYEEQ